MDRNESAICDGLKKTRPLDPLTTVSFSTGSYDARVDSSNNWTKIYPSCDEILKCLRRTILFELKNLLLFQDLIDSAFLYN